MKNTTENVNIFQAMTEGNLKKGSVVAECTTWGEKWEGGAAAVVNEA